MLAFLVLYLIYVCGPIPKEPPFNLPLWASPYPCSSQNSCPIVTNGSSFSMYHFKTKELTQSHDRSFVAGSLIGWWPQQYALNPSLCSYWSHTFHRLLLVKTGCDTNTNASFFLQDADSSNGWLWLEDSA